MKNFFLLKFDSYISAILYCCSKQFHRIQISFREITDSKELPEISFDHETLIFFSSPQNIINTANSTTETIHATLIKNRKHRKKMR